MSFLSSSRFVPLALVGAVAMTMLQGAAFASEARPAVLVSHADLNLADPADVGTLNDRITAAARRVCRAPDARDLQALSAAQLCRADAIAAAHGSRDVKVAQAQAAMLAMRTGNAATAQGSAE